MIDKLFKKFDRNDINSKADFLETVGNVGLGLLRIGFGKAVKVTKLSLADHSLRFHPKVYSTALRVGAIAIAVLTLPITLLLAAIGCTGTALSKSHQQMFDAYMASKQVFPKSSTKPTVNTIPSQSEKIPTERKKELDTSTLSPIGIAPSKLEESKKEEPQAAVEIPLEPHTQAADLPTRTTTPENLEERESQAEPDQTEEDLMNRQPIPETEKLIDELGASFLMIEGANNQTDENFIDSFCIKYHHQQPIDHIKQWIIVGQKEYDHFTQRKDKNNLIQELNQLKPEVLEQKLASIVWFLMFRAFRKDQDFEEGAFILPDPNHHLADIFAGLKIGAERISSHLKGHDTKKHLGIDINTAPLPYGKMHLLLIPIFDRKQNQARLYLKPENFGVNGIVALAGHTYEYIISVGRKTAPSVFGSDDAEGNRKERVPKEMIREFNRLLNTQRLDDKTVREIKAHATTYGIGYMHQYASEQKENEELQRFAEVLRNIYGDNLQARIGNEVLLSNSWIEPSP